MSRTPTPFSLKDAPALIERLMPVQKLSAEAYKEQMAGSGKSLTALGSYWKGRKPLVLVKACVLGCLLPATDDPALDLSIFELLMGMDEESFVARSPRRATPKQLLGELEIPRVADLFTAEPADRLPKSAPVDWTATHLAGVRVAWRDDVGEAERRRLEAMLLPEASYRDRVSTAKRPEEVGETLHSHIWVRVNAHLGTHAASMPQLVEQLGVMRFGRRPRVADTFSGSGQIGFESARLGCDVYASDLNPVACMLTWGAFNIIGGNKEALSRLADARRVMVDAAEAEVTRLGVEEDGKGWRAKIFLYCNEVRCPQTGWLVPMLPNLILNRVRSIILELVPNPAEQKYAIGVRVNVSREEMAAAEVGTVRVDGRSQDPYLLHLIDGVEYRTKLSTLRGDYRTAEGAIANRLRLWEKTDITPRDTDIFQERLCAIQWMRPTKSGRGEEYDIRAVTPDDLVREKRVEDHVRAHLEEWQDKGWIPDMRIEPGDKTDEPIRTRGWTHWHHLFNPRQLLVGALLNRISDPGLKLGLAGALNSNSRLSRFASGGSGAAMVAGVFDNQALNTLVNYGCRGLQYALDVATPRYKSFPIDPGVQSRVSCHSADEVDGEFDVFLTDPPYGDAVKYEEILEFFISWLRKNPPSEFADWVWDSRRALAIAGEDESFRRGMIASYRRMTSCMPGNGLQVIMFTHQSGSIWADMANIVWAAGLQVTAAWYVVTETDSALRDGSHVKGTVLLVCRKRQGAFKTTRDELAWDIQEEVEEQVKALAGLNQEVRGLYKDENVFEDADIQMAGYAAALRALTRFSIIDGRDMATEAVRPRQRGVATFVDNLISFAVDTANQMLVPEGVRKDHWEKLSGAERFYLKMLDLEARGLRMLDNYQNFAKAFKVRNFNALMHSRRTNHARLKGAVEFGRGEMSQGSELHETLLRAILYAVMELRQDVDGVQVLAHLTLNVPNYYGDMTQRERAVEIADFLAARLDTIRAEEASSARVLRELIKNQQMG